jgi:hypothetical protein
MTNSVFCPRLAANVGQPVQGGGSPDGSQTVSVWIIFKTRARRSGYLPIWIIFKTRARRSGYFHEPQIGPRAARKATAWQSLSALWAVSASLGFAPRVLFNRALPHHPACGCASLSLALRAACRLVVSLRSAATRRTPSGRHRPRDSASASTRPPPDAPPDGRCVRPGTRSCVG